MKKIIFLGFVLMVGLFASVSSYAQNTTQEQSFKKAAGTVVTMDWVGGTLIVDTGGDQITFVVSGDTEVVKGPEEIALADINTNDYVTVEYCDRCFVGLKAVKINVRTTES
jgi:hypothetical protein